MRIRVLPLGLVYIAAAVVVSAAAANTGNNALYMISALMLALFIVSGVLSILSLGRLEAERTMEGELSARVPSAVYVEVRNRGRWPQAGIRLNGRPCPPLPARSARLVRLDLEFPRRGLHALPPLLLESRFPFGFLGWWKPAGLHGEVLVYPYLGALDEPIRSRRKEPGGEERSSRWGEVLDHRGLKLFAEGDDPRHMHWKKTAQRGELVAVEYDHRSRGAFELYLETRSANPARFEREIETIASACDRLLREGAPVALSTPHSRFAAGSGAGHRRRLLGFLALVEPGA